MQFNSWIFLAAFLPALLIAYFTLNKYFNKRIASYSLIIGNLIFYSYAGIEYTCYLLFCIAVNYLLAKYLISNPKKMILILGLIFNLGSLAFLKYSNFFISSINSIFRKDYNLIHLFLPMGLSFFTFQFIALIYDCYKGKIQDLCLVKYLAFSSYFPKIVQGPIMTYQDFDQKYDLEKRDIIQFENLSKGLFALSVGFGKKILIADVLGKFVNTGFGSEYVVYNSTMSILLALSYTLQIYFDFSGYSDMARGISLMFNIELPRNFYSPYKALSINSFWKRWHMSLTNFFTKYLYIPLGGNRKGELRTYLNVIIVFTLSGLWHGSNYTFIIWGFLHGVLSVIERKWNFLPKLHIALQWLYTFVFTNIAWIFFRSNSLSQALVIIKNILRCDFSGINLTSLSVIELPEITLLIDFLPFEFLHRIYPLGFLGALLLIVLQGKNTDEIIEKFKPTVPKMIFTVIVMSWCILSFGNKITFIYEMF